MRLPHTHQVNASVWLCTASEHGLQEAMLYGKLSDTTVHTIHRRMSIQSVHGPHAASLDGQKIESSVECQTPKGASAFPMSM